MKKKISSFILLGIALAISTPLASCGGGKDDPHTNPEDNPEVYDNFMTDLSKDGHLYVHYNRGEGKTDYNDFCFWMWNDDTDTDGTLWAYSKKTEVSPTLTLLPMSTHWMTCEELGVEGGDKTYIDKYGVIADIDLSKTLFNGKIQKGETKSVAKYDTCKNLGFLFPLAESMTGVSHWTSDGGKDNVIEDWRNEKNLRSLKDGGTAEHIFLATGQLENPAFFVGSGAPVVRINPMDVDTSGDYRSKTEGGFADYGVSSTSDVFKEIGVGYQVFVASFRDSNGDGYGDIKGITDSLDYFQDLGIKALWLTPIQKSDSYHGYDISDYYAVDPKFGTIDDYRELLVKAHERGIKVIMDLVLNHTSKSNVWFKKSQWGVNSGAPGAETDDTGINWRDVYTWKFATDPFSRKKRTYHPDPKDDGHSTYGTYEFGEPETITIQQDAADPAGASWYRNGESNYYYYGKFGSSMPELNYDNKATRKLVIDMAKYWMSFGLDGFRLDAVKHIYMNDESTNAPGDVIIPDTGTKKAYDDERGAYIAQPYDYSTNQTKNVKWWKEFSNEVKAQYPNCFLVGENFDGYGTRTAAYYQGLDSQFDFANYYHVPAYFYTDACDASTYANTEASETYDTFRNAGPYQISNPDGSKSYVDGGNRGDAINGAFTSNHDVMRAINQANPLPGGTATSTTANDNIDCTLSGHAGLEQLGRAKVMAAVTILNPGCSWIYYGDELAMSSNTNKHISLYHNENSMDIWYRQPMLWKDNTARPHFKAGQYTFEYDSNNSAMLYDKDWGVEMRPELDGEGNVSKYNVVTNNPMYDFYKKLIQIKNAYPKNAQVNFEYSSSNVLVITAYSNDSNRVVRSFINIGKNDNEYIIGGANIAGYEPFVTIGCNQKTPGENFGEWWAVCSYIIN
ncbi:MAG: hypothetical protein KBS97_04005 [Firmicutes bacterium]|nr:hypothetical protein [Candidatus Fiminaster equi]